MGNCNTSPAYLSAEPHGSTADSPGTITDLTAHYLGCIKTSDCAEFLDKDKNCQFWDHEIHAQLEKLHQQNRDMPENECEEMAIMRVDEEIKGLALNIESQYRRTKLLRKALSEVKCSFCKV
ncbi:uncharacterized protein LY79DRAFT_695711 [Colletotrichum navitas]|uniref:Uncharacterized protein n=1 Tax=Colletotrichum navitas TaxID=681940 RepID=A0AAD8PPW8_9PEZI|nr:uncharacterized protein LY79DRAFT_695711 [Colletotrichum navitas]KAK1574239.1 hypothetical protein LY79DRAFT_695711 [Colletotrichum navitas]